MLTSLSLIFLVGLSLAALCHRIRLPQIVGMLVSGVILGPYVLDFFDPTILGISSELREMALVIFLIKAGLSLNLEDLKKVGRPALLMSCLPALFELVAIVLFAPLIMGISSMEAAIMGGSIGCSFTGSGRAKNGTAYGRKKWNKKAHTSDDPGRGISR